MHIPQNSVVDHNLAALTNGRAVVVAEVREVHHEKGRNMGDVVETKITSASVLKNGIRLKSVLLHPRLVIQTVTVLVDLLKARALTSPTIALKIQPESRVSDHPRILSDHQWYPGLIGMIDPILAGKVGVLEDVVTDVNDLDKTTYGATAVPTNTHHAHVQEPVRVPDHDRALDPARGKILHEAKNTHRGVPTC